MQSPQDRTPQERRTVTIQLDRCNVTGGYQLSIGSENAEGYGHGYRIFGPKFIGDSTSIRKMTIDKRTADAIRGYLDEVEAGDAR